MSAHSYSLAARGAGSAARGAGGFLSAEAAQLLSGAKRPADDDDASQRRAEHSTEGQKAAKTTTEQNGLQQMVAGAVAGGAASEASKALLALVRVDAQHIKGDLLLEEHIEAFGKAVHDTQEILTSKKLGEPGSKTFYMINGSLGAATCIMVTLECCITAEAIGSRFGTGGLAVLESGVLVAYKVMPGLQWYKEAAEADLKALPEDTIALVYRGLPDPEAVIDFYTEHGVENYGKLMREPVVNQHMWGGIKSGYQDGSLTLVFHNEKGVKTIAETPLMLTPDIKLGELSLSRRRVQMLNGKACKDDKCRGFNGFHKLTCAASKIHAEQKRARVVAETKSFSKTLEVNAAAVQGVRKLLKAKYNGSLCQRFERSGVPCYDCKWGPCRDWEELVETELSATVYAKMNDNIRPKKSTRGSRGKRPDRQRGKENEESEEEMSE
jgi:hypothetical protein